MSKHEILNQVISSFCENYKTYTQKAIDNQTGEKIEIKAIHCIRNGSGYVDDCIKDKDGRYAD